MSGISDHGYLKLMSGDAEFRRVTGTLEADVFAIKAMNAEDVVFGADCEVSGSDAPNSGDTLAAGETLFGAFTKVHITSGVAYCYLKK